jgi:hAT family C-terminal dimerisation region/Domain of unknown function (DUF4413)
VPVQTIAGILSSFAHAAPQLSATSRPTLNETLPMYNYVFDNLEDFCGACMGQPCGREKAALIDACSPASKDVLRRALNKAHDKLRKYYSTSYADMYAIVLVLDPRYKMAYFEAHGWESTWMTWAKDAIARAVRAYGAGGLPTDVGDDEEYAGQMQEHIFRPIKRRRLQEADELTGYLAEPVIDDKADVLGWWRENAGRYPVLARIARDYLAIPASSASSERAFSGGADLVVKKRGSLNGDTIRACTCLSSWWK